MFGVRIPVIRGKVGIGAAGKGEEGLVRGCDSQHCGLPGKFGPAKPLQSYYDSKSISCLPNLRFRKKQFK
jgi:hypothetical protein